MKYIIGISLLIVVVLGIVFYRLQPRSMADETPSTHEVSQIVFDTLSYDFGVVKQSGGVVTHEFPFVYRGSDAMTVTGLAASCGCTSAVIEPSHLEPGMKGVVTVSFNPNLHAEPEGRFYKTVSLLTEPALSLSPELKIWAEVDLDLGEAAFTGTPDHDEGLEALQSENLAPEKEYKTISAATLHSALEDKDFFLVDVHTPEQPHIAGTDAVIPFDQIGQRLGELPQDKNAAIVLYCRSGSMSQQAAQTLMDAGYTNVFHVEGGAQAFNQLMK